MEEKTLLEEIKKEQEIEVQKKFIAFKENNALKPEKIEKKGEKTINIFSSASFPNSSTLKTLEKEEEKELNKIESKVSSVIEKPNYDYMETLSDSERKKIFVVSHEEPKSKPKPNRFKALLISIVFAIFGVWGVVNIALLDNVSSQIAEVTTQYQLNLITYLKNLYTLDATNSENMENLFETIPEDGQGATEVKPESNWFDRFCNFLGGLLGG